VLDADPDEREAPALTAGQSQSDELAERLKQVATKEPVTVAAKTTATV
jgi:hypothetical protein